MIVTSFFLTFSRNSRLVDPTIVSAAVSSWTLREILFSAERKTRSFEPLESFFFFSSFSRKIHRKVSKKNNLKGDVFRSVALLGGSLSLCLRNSIILFLRPLTTLRALRPIISSIFITHRAASALIKATLRSRVFLPLCESV